MDDGHPAPERSLDEDGLVYVLGGLLIVEAVFLLSLMIWM